MASHLFHHQHDPAQARRLARRTLLKAGGGIRGGQVYGSSDKIGGQPVDDPVHVRDLFATIYHALGFSHDTKALDPTGRPHFFVEGNVVDKLF